MAQGTVLFKVVDALLDLLEARPALAGVTIQYSLDDTPLDLSGDHVWFGGEATNVTEQALLRTTPVISDEFVEFTMHFQVIESGSDQRTVDRRCHVLFAEMQEQLAYTPECGVASSSEYQVLKVQPNGWDFTSGPVRAGANEGGNGARIDVAVQIRSRIK